MNPIYITYRDEIGIVLVCVDASGIAFANGKAYFSDEEGNEYAIPVAHLVEVNRL